MNAWITRYVGSKSSLELSTVHVTRKGYLRIWVAIHMTDFATMEMLCKRCKTRNKRHGKLEGIFRNKTMQLAWKMGMWGM